jgi:hypothetical protein
MAGVAAAVAGPISFEAALAGLVDNGTKGVVAAFRIGWDVERLRNVPTGPSEDDSPQAWAARRVLRVESALTDLTLPAIAVPNAEELFGVVPSTNTSGLMQAVQGLSGTPTSDLTPVVDQYEKQVRCALAIAKATAPLPADTAGPPLQTMLEDAFHLGILLAKVRQRAVKADATWDDLRAAFALQEPDSDAGRAHALLTSLRGYFPSGAAYAVARHLEDWAAWASESPVVSARPTMAQLSGKRLTRPLSIKGPLPTAVKGAVKAQGKIWESILTGQSLGKDYLVAASWADAADHLLVSWSQSVASLARSLWSTLVGKLALCGIGALVAAFIAAFVYGLAETNTLHGGGQAVAIVGGGIAAIAAALGVHVSRTQVNGTVSKAWSFTEQPLVDSEVYEGIAMATRRLPTEGISGGAGAGRLTLADRRARAKSAKLARGPKPVPSGQ